MRIESSFLYSFFVCCSVLVLSNPCPVSSQQLDMDREDRMFLDKPFIEETKAEIAAEMAGFPKPQAQLRESKEIKYVAGPDEKWFTKDDDVYEYFLLYYDDKSRLVKRSGFLEGPDDLLMTRDDILHDYMIYKYGPDGKISREIFYDGKGVLQYTGVYRYDEHGLKLSVKRFDPQKKEIGSSNYFHGHAGLIIKDIEYKGDEIEKYHNFKYDSKHRTGRVIEFLGSEGGKGPDGIWFTADDAVTSAKQCFYKSDGTKDKEKKYIEPGPDKKWFTKDDVMQYYTVFYYHK
ncbi:MAG: hypothetical protein WC547_07850 [Candidatus Omnitrophota bacterium]